MQLAQHVKFRKEQFGGVLFETQSERVFTLNDAAVDILGELRTDGTANAAAIAERLKQRYRDPSNQIEQDVRRLIDDLCARGLVIETPV